MPADLLAGFAGSTFPAVLAQQGIGVVAPFDFALDRELWRWVPDDVSLYLTRLPYLPVPVTVEMAWALSEAEPLRRATLDVLTPEPGAVAYACASGSFIDGVRGERGMVETMRAAGAPAAVTTSGGLAEALALLGIRRLAVATPYIDPVTERLVSYLAECGVETVSRVGLGLLGQIWRTSYADVVEIVRTADRPEAEAMFISCTNLPTFDVIEPLEAALGKPVLTANQVTMWAALRALGIATAPNGQLLTQSAARWAA